MGLLERNLQRVRQPLHRRVVVLEHHTVHHDLDGVLLLLVQRDLLGQVVRFAVDPRPDEPRPARILKFFAVLTLADRKSTRLNSSHGYISYAVFCLKKKKNKSQKSTST